MEENPSHAIVTSLFINVYDLVDYSIKHALAHAEVTPRLVKTINENELLVQNSFVVLVVHVIGSTQDNSNASREWIHNRHN